MEPIQFLDAVSGYRPDETSSADRPIKLAKIDPAYDPFPGSYPDAVAPAKVTFEGESTLSGKLYPVASGFIPTPGARVWMVPIGTTYMIAGGAASYTTQGFYAYADGSQVGVEFGEGNYWDTLAGLVLDTDADIGGDLTVGGIGAVRHVRKTADTSRVTSTRTVDPHLAGLLLDVGTWEITVTYRFTGTTGDLATAWAFTGTYSGEKEVLSATAASETFDLTNVAGRFAVFSVGTAIGYAMDNTSTPGFAVEKALVTVTAAGSLSIEWGQQTTSASPATILKTGSRIRAERIA